MPLNTGVVVVQGSPGSLYLKNQTPIVVFGTTTTGTIVAGTLTRIRTTDEATTLVGAGGVADTLPKAIAILQSRYQCGNIIAVKLTGADAAAQETDLVSKLDLLNNAMSVLGEQPRIILFPSFNSDAVITKAITVAGNTLAVAIANFNPGTTVSTAITTRGTATGLGKKDERLIVVHGHLKNSVTPTTLESMGIHLAGIMAGLPYGRSPLNQPLVGVNGIDVPYVFGLGDENSDPEKLSDVGVLPVNLSGTQLVAWGGRNSKYAEASTDVLTFINAVRSRDEISILARGRAAKILGQPSNFSTASLLTESYRNMLDTEVSLGNIRSYTKVEINPTKTDYNAFKIWHDLEFQVWLPIELITVNIVMSVVNV